MKIDSEVYFWKYDQNLNTPFIRSNKMLQQNYLPEQITQSLHRNGIGGCIATATEPTEVETRFLSELAITHPDIHAVIGWIDLYDARALDKLEEFKQYHPIVGYRLESKNQNLPIEEVMDFLRLHALTLDITLNAENDAPKLNGWIKSQPEQSFILQDSGSPDTKGTVSKSWESAIQLLAKNENLSCKVSGMLERSNSKSWKPADFYPFLDILFDAFGPERLLFASNWPFILVSGMYLQWKSLMEKYMEKFTEEDRDNFFGENASRVYSL